MTELATAGPLEEQPANAPSIRELLSAYDDMLEVAQAQPRVFAPASKGSFLTFRPWPTSWFLQAFVVDHMERNLRPVTRALDRRAALGDDDAVDPDQTRVDRFLQSLPPVQHRRVAVFLGVATGLLLTGLLDTHERDIALAVVPGAVGLDAPSAVRTVDTISGSEWLQFFAVILLPIAIVLSVPAGAFRLKRALFTSWPDITTTPSRRVPWRSAVAAANRLGGLYDLERDALRRYGVEPRERPVDLYFLVPLTLAAILSPVLLFDSGTAAALWGVYAPTVGGLALYHGLARTFARQGGDPRTHRLRRVLLAFAATGISVAAFVLVLRAQTSATEPESGASASFDSVRLVERGVDLGRFLEQHHLSGLHPARSVYRPPKGAPRPAAGRQAAAERLAARIRARERNPGQVVAYTLQLHGYERTGVHLRWEVHDAQTGKVAEQDVADPYEQVVIRNRDETIANDVWVPSPPSGGRYFIKIAAWRVAQTKDPHRLEVVVIAGGDTGDFDAP